MKDLGPNCSSTSRDMHACPLRKTSLPQAMQEVRFNHFIWSCSATCRIVKYSWWGRKEKEQPVVGWGHRETRRSTSVPCAACSPQGHHRLFFMGVLLWPLTLSDNWCWDLQGITGVEWELQDVLQMGGWQPGGGRVSGCSKTFIFALTGQPLHPKISTGDHNTYSKEYLIKTQSD